MTYSQKQNCGQRIHSKGGQQILGLVTVDLRNNGTKKTQDTDKTHIVMLEDCTNALENEETQDSPQQT